ncbi:DUF2971 domain-containing protein [Dorea phocaeensis]|uniref:DUF2971 domain-containing protein n=1 Tax=Dorea phocaeensis TaxID=2040291 RepID=UPI000C763CC4|nr:DUF2971 domain-containing protein [Dorea phocaeensis]
MENLQTKSEKQYYIPMEVNETSKEFIIANGFDLSTDAVWTKIGHRTVRAIMIPATKEQYLEYMRPLWREDKQGQRASKQEDESKMQPVSLDQLYESTEYEVSDRYAVSKTDVLEGNKDFLYKTTCRKSDVWSYEKEWRIITANFNKVMPQKLKYPNGKYVLDLKDNIKAFYLGAKISDDFKYEMIQFGERNGISVYQMMLSSKTYELQAKKIV